MVAGANRHDPPPLRLKLKKLGRFERYFGLGLPEAITVHLDAGHDSATTRELIGELGCQAVIGKKGLPLQAGARWVVERTNSWDNRGFRKLLVCTERRTQVIPYSGDNGPLPSDDHPPAGTCRSPAASPYGPT